MSSFLLGAISAAAVVLHFGVKLPPKLYTDKIALTVISQESDPGAISRLRLSDRLFAEATVSSNQPDKKSFATQPASTVEPPPETEQASDENASGTPDAGEELLPSENYGDGPSVSGSEMPEAPEGKRVLPSLYYDAAKQQRIIGNFATRSFPGRRETCTEIGQSMARDSSGNTNALQTLADTSAIMVLKICAANGTVVLTCRSGQVTISPRQARPDDKCDDYRSKRLAESN